MKKSILLYATITLFSFFKLSALIPAPAANTAAKTTAPLAVAAPAPKAVVAKAIPIAKAVPKAAAAKTAPIPAPKTIAPVMTKPFVAPVAQTVVKPSKSGKYTIPLPFPPVKIALTPGHTTSGNTASLTGITMLYTTTNQITNETSPTKKITASNQSIPIPKTGLSFTPKLTVTSDVQAISADSKGVKSIEIDNQSPITFSPAWTGGAGESPQIYIIKSKTGKWSQDTKTMKRAARGLDVSSNKVSSAAKSKEANPPTVNATTVAATKLDKKTNKKNALKNTKTTNLSKKSKAGRVSKTVTEKTIAAKPVSVIA
ncbi:MAG: hypothetical protein NTZ68_03750 [Candidatus Dependentiae bacterium]|nr:hypothetical protein [Candidatus Dependentiae bacterium]